MAVSSHPQCGHSAQTIAVETMEVSRRAIPEHISEQVSEQRCPDTSSSVHEQVPPTRSLRTEVAVSSSRAKGPTVEGEPLLPETEMGQRQLCKGRRAALPGEQWCQRTTRHCSPPRVWQGWAEWAEKQREALEAWGAAAVAKGSRELCVTAGLTMWALFPPRDTSAPLRVEDEERSREHLPGPRGELCTAGWPTHEPT